MWVCLNTVYSFLKSHINPKSSDCCTWISMNWCQKETELWYIWLFSINFLLLPINAYFNIWHLYPVWLFGLYFSNTHKSVVCIAIVTLIPWTLSLWEMSVDYTDWLWFLQYFFFILVSATEGHNDLSTLNGKKKNGGKRGPQGGTN